jgi:hypothetical protein
MMEAIRTSETSVYSNETTWLNIPEGSNLHTRRRVNLKSHIHSTVGYATTNDATTNAEDLKEVFSCWNKLSKLMKDYHPILPLWKWTLIILMTP